MSRRRLPKKGDRVAILNLTMGGRLCLEGYATVVKPPVSEDERAEVRFADGGEVFERWIDPNAQADPEAYIAGINEAMTRVQS